MSFSGIFSTLMLLGALQGFIMSGLLFFSKKRPARDRLLAILILLIALACLNLHIFESSWINELPLLQFLLNFVPLVVVMPLGPLLYFYVKSSLDPAFRVNTTHRPHFYSTIIDIVPQLIAVTYVGGVMGGILKNHPQPWGIAIDTYNVYADIPRWFSMTIYVYLSYRYISSAQVNNRKTPSLDKTIPESLPGLSADLVCLPGALRHPKVYRQIAGYGGLVPGIHSPGDPDLLSRDQGIYDDGRRRNNG